MRRRRVQEVKRVHKPVRKEALTQKTKYKKVAIFLFHIYNDVSVAKKRNVNS